MTEALRLIVSSKANEAEIIVASGIAIEICAGAKFIIETHRVGIVAEPVVGQWGENVRIVLKILNLDENPHSAVRINALKTIPEIGTPQLPPAVWERRLEKDRKSVV